MIDPECEKVYLVYNITNLNEGHGREYVYAITELETTAERLAKDAGVGCDCRIVEFETVLFYDDKRYLPLNVIPIFPPSVTDINQQKERDKKLEAKKKFEFVLQKAKELGLTDEEIAILKTNQTGE